MSRVQSDLMQASGAILCLCHAFEIVFFVLVTSGVRIRHNDAFLDNDALFAHKEL